VLEDGENRLPFLTRQTLLLLWEQVKWADQRIDIFEKQLSDYARQNEVIQRLLTIPGVGILTATAMYAKVSRFHDFKSARQLAAWMGLTPRQYTTGGNIILGRITKKGDAYLRRCFTLGAKALMPTMKHRVSKDRNLQWFESLIQRRGPARAIVAMAARNVRIAWTLMVKQENYSPKAA